MAAMEINKRTYDTIVIGAGPAGLAAGYFLEQQRRSFAILEQADQLGASWRNRYESLVLFSPARYSALPGLPLPLPPRQLPTREEIADYLVAYASVHRLPVLMGRKVTCVFRKEPCLIVRTEDEVFFVRNVIVATGSCRVPMLPCVPGQADFAGLQLHSSAYRNPAQIPPGNVLVVGAGNAGAQIAAELATTHRVTFSVRRPPDFRPLDVLGKNTVWWLDKLGLLHLSAWLGKRWQQWREPVLGDELQQLIELKRTTLKYKTG